MPALAAELGISGRVLTSAGKLRHPRLPVERVNLLYNACDVGLNTARAEGWGLLAFEHAAAGAAQVVPDHRAELWRERALLVPTERCPGGRAPTEAGVERALSRLHDEPELRERIARAGHAHATSPRFDWGAIARRWERLLLRTATLARRGDDEPPTDRAERR